jgi:metal-responsive CopG/Arc/MetJ family transcriptional regulator
MLEQIDETRGLASRSAFVEKLLRDQLSIRIERAPPLES